LERRAELLLKTKEFKDLSTSAKRRKVERILQLAKKDTKDNIKKSVVVKDREQELLFSLDKKYSERDIKRALKDLDISEDLEDLNYLQLQTIEAYMDGSDDYIKRTTD